MRRALVCILGIFYTCLIQAQTEAQAGYSVGLNRFFESKLDNLATQFNLGWDFDGADGSYKLAFEPGISEYTIENPMNWNRTTSGVLLGVGFLGDQRIGFDLNFVGCTNSASGSRTNKQTNVEEKLTLKTKFGGVQFLANFNVNDWLTLNAGIGVNMFRARYSWTGDLEIKNQTIGLRINPLSSEVKAGDRDLTLVFPVGITAQLIEINQFSIKSRLNYTFVWNDMVETDFITEYAYRYNLNNLSLSLFLTRTF
jgi:opacity protein-like surface antigen